MSILTRFIIKNWFKFFAASFFALFFIVSASNILSTMLQSKNTIYDIVADFVLKLPWILSKIFPVSCLNASLFSINQMKSKSELTAIFATGYSYFKFLSIVFCCSLLIALVQFSTSSYLDPYLRKNKDRISFLKKATRTDNQKLGLISTIDSGQVWYKSNNYFLSFADFNIHSKKLSQISIFYFDEHFLLNKKVFAKSAKHLRDNVWEFYNVTSISNTTGFNYPTPSTHPQLEIKLDETSVDFEKIIADISQLNAVDLYAYITKLNDLGIATYEYLIMLYDKFATAITCIIFALLSSFGIFTPGRRNSSFGINVTASFIFSIGFWLANAYLTSLGQAAKITPFASQFSLPILFFLIILINFLRNRKLSS